MRHSIALNWEEEESQEHAISDGNEIRVLQKSATSGFRIFEFKNLIFGFIIANFCILII
jgi:hypothetical protein